MVIFIAIATLVSTLLGGMVALKFKDKLHLILGFSAGAVIGVAFFDILPESIALSSKHYDVSTITAISALGFILFMILDRFMLIHGHPHGDETELASPRGPAGALTLAIHSFLDGLAIGLAFKISSEVGMIVAVAVLVHDFSDGMNTVNMILKNKGDSRVAYRWLIVDAVAPVLGILATFFFALPDKFLGLILAMFGGFFLYIGASDMLPESHHRHPKFITTLMTILGVTVLFVTIKLAGI